MYEKFARLLQEKGVTPYRVHKETGVSQSTLSDWKNGKSVPKIDKLQLIADYFEVPVSYFWEEEQEKSPPAQAEELTVEQILADARSRLENEKGLMFDGGVASQEAIDSILAAMEIGLEVAMKKTKEERERSQNLKREIIEAVNRKMNGDEQ